MSTIPVYVIASFLLAFKAVLIEGSEVAIISLAVLRQIGKGNVMFGIIVGGLGSILTFLAVREVFILLPDTLINIVTGIVILYFSYRFLRGFVKYYFGGKSFRAKMQRMEQEIIEKEQSLAHDSSKTQPTSDLLSPAKETAQPQMVEQHPKFSPTNAFPVISITLTEGFEASLVLAAAGAFSLSWTIIGALTSIVLLIGVCAVSYDYLMRVPRWFLDLFAGVVLLSFGLFFLLSGILAGIGIIA